MEISEITYEDLEANIKKYNPRADINLIKEAYEFAQKVHATQKRDSGEDYIQHLLHTANILTKLKQDSQTIIAGLLHDSLEKTNTKPSHIEEKFGEEVLTLVQAVTKIKTMGSKNRQESDAENLRKILLATAKDIRVILIKLADRLHNMQTLKSLSEERQKRIAQETLDIYAPIAHKLGIHKIKSELEDLCLKHLNPEIYQDIKTKVASKRHEREQTVKELIQQIIEKIRTTNIPVVKIYGRAKSFYSIYKKMKQKNKTFEEVSFDLIAIRIIAQTVDECYKILGILHSSWSNLPSEFQDYISNPKPNGYQSIHTHILYEKQPIEVQIRTMDMHKEAEEGIAAHWRYKGGERDKKFDRKISWLKQILEWKSTSKNAMDFIETLKIDLFKDEIIVLTPKGEPISLPEGSTPIDFAYEIHTSVGNQTAQAKVNGQIKPLNYELQSGDVIEILTRRNAKPSRQWLASAKTNLAKSKIRQTLNIQAPTKKRTGFTNDQKILENLNIDIDKSLLRLPHCCEIREEKEIIGHKTKDGKIHLHNINCPNIREMESSKLIKINTKRQQSRIIKLSITVEDRTGLAVDVLSIISKKKINIQSINTKSHRNHIILSIDINRDEMTDQNIKDLIAEIKAIPNVIDACIM